MDGSIGFPEREDPERDESGRYRRGSSGNPAGKKPGTRNRATLLKASLNEGEDATIARVVVEKALAGDAVAARFVLERLQPRPRGRAIHLAIPEGESAAGDVVATFNAALKAMAAGEITPDEALAVARFLEGRFRVLKAWKLEQTLTRWDNPLPIPGDGRPSPIPNPPPKQGWPDVLERVRLWGAPWPPPAAPAGKSAKPTQISSPPARGEKDAQGWRGAAEPYPKLDEGGAAARKVAERPGTNPSAGAAHPHPAPAKLGDASLSLRNLLPQAGEGETGVPASNSTSPPLFTPHLRSLIEASMADPADNRWLPVLAKEWGLEDRLRLHLPCKSGTQATPAAADKTASAPAPAKEPGPKPPLHSTCKSATPPEPSVAPTTPPLKPAAANPATPPAPSPQEWVSRTPMPRPRRSAEMPRVITRKPH
jgi:hypothetical protein